MGFLILAKMLDRGTQFNSVRKVMSKRIRDNPALWYAPTVRTILRNACAVCELAGMLWGMLGRQRLERSVGMSKISEPVKSLRG